MVGQRRHGDGYDNSGCMHKNLHSNPADIAKNIQPQPDGQYDSDWMPHVNSVRNIAQVCQGPILQVQDGFGIAGKIQNNYSKQEGINFMRPCHTRHHDPDDGPIRRPLSPGGIKYGKYAVFVIEMNVGRQTANRHAANA